AGRLERQAVCGTLGGLHGLDRQRRPRQAVLRLLGHGTSRAATLAPARRVAWQETPRRGRPGRRLNLGMHYPPSYNLLGRRPGPSGGEWAFRDPCFLPLAPETGEGGARLNRPPQFFWGRRARVS